MAFDRARLARITARILRGALVVFALYCSILFVDAIAGLLTPAPIAVIGLISLPVGMIAAAALVAMRMAGWPHPQAPAVQAAPADPFQMLHGAGTTLLAILAGLGLALVVPVLIDALIPPYWTPTRSWVVAMLCGGGLFAAILAWVAYWSLGGHRPKRPN